MGVRCVMVDHDPQPEAPKGSDCIVVQCDVTKMELKELQVDWIQGSPPCLPTSTAPQMGGVSSKVPQLIPKFREMVNSLNVWRAVKGLPPMRWMLENVASSGELMKASMMTDGMQIGSRVNRKRMLECNWNPNCELSHSLRLCLGDRAKWPRTDDKLLDRFMKEAVKSGVALEAKPEFHLTPPCCRGSSWSPVGSHTSHTGSRYKWAAAMGVESVRIQTSGLDPRGDS